MVGLCVSSAAFILLVSAFNGIEGMIKNMYSAFDQEVMVLPAKGKSLTQEDINGVFRFCKEQKEVLNQSKFIRERVLLRNENKWANAEMWAVEPVFFDMAELNDEHHLLVGKVNKNKDQFFFGHDLAVKLGMNQLSQDRKTLLYLPKQDAKIGLGKNPFFQESIALSGVLNYNKEVNEEVLLVPISFAQSFYPNSRFSGILVSTRPQDAVALKQKILSKFPSQFRVQTNEEKNQLVYKTSQSEKRIVMAILGFIFILSMFNLVASLTMIFIEKEKMFKPMVAMGFTLNKIRAIFYQVGSLITFLGISSGILMGQLLVYFQLRFSLLLIPGTNKAFPMAFKAGQSFSIIGILFLLGILASWSSATFLTKSVKKDFYLFNER